MKKTSLILALSAGLILASCGGNTSSSATGLSSSEPSVPSSGASQDSKGEITVESVLAKLEEGFAFAGSFSSTGHFGEETFEMGNYYLVAALEPTYAYVRMDYAEEDYSETALAERYENDDGDLARDVLDPLTNEVERVYAEYGEGQRAAFADYFRNPFGTAEDYKIEDSALVLENLEGIDMEAFSFLVGRGSLILGGAPASFSISFDGDGNPETITAKVVNDEYAEYGESYEYNMLFAFDDPSVLGVSGAVAPRESQDGQEKLAAMFERLQAGNYTITVSEYAEDMTPGEEYDYLFAGAKEMSRVTLGTGYVTADDYYVEVEYLQWGETADKGLHKVEGGYAEFKTLFDEDGEAYLGETKAPYLNRNPGYFFEGYEFDARCFDVEEDGSYTLASGFGFYDVVFDGLLPDSNVISVCYPDEGSLKFTIDEESDTLSYEYTGYRGEELFEVVVSDIGTTEMPIDMSAIVPYVRATNWTEYAAKDEWNEDYVAKLDLLTAGHVDDLPFADLPYNYFRSANTEDIYHEPENPEYWWEGWSEPVYTREATIVWEVDSEEEMNLIGEGFAASIISNSHYSVDAENECFIYTNEDGANVTVELYGVENFVGFGDEDPFAYGVVLQLTNNVPYVPAE